MTHVPVPYTTQSFESVLRRHIPRESWSSWFDGRVSFIDRREGYLMMLCNNGFIAKEIWSRFEGAIRTTMQETAHRRVKVYGECTNKSMKMSECHKPKTHEIFKIDLDTE